jgi:hypothetical protein
MIRADGGSGDYIETTPPMLGIWNTLLDGSADATWVSWHVFFVCHGAATSSSTLAEKHAETPYRCVFSHLCDYLKTTPPMLGIWNTLLDGSADATWVSTMLVTDTLELISD